MKRARIQPLWTWLTIACLLSSGGTVSLNAEDPPVANVTNPAASDQSADCQPFEVDRLVAWCIVPFDAHKRSPAERAEMMERLGMKRIAYDWRAEHVASFEEEILQYKQRGLEFFAFWSWHDDFAPLVKTHDIHPQFWVTCPSPPGKTQAERVDAAARQLLPLVEKTGALDCSLGLYNHGGWGGQPDNLIAVCKRLRELASTERVGIVYNFHHGHADIDGFADSFRQMQPHLLCVNLNGMADAKAVDGLKNKIIPIGSGQHERAMIETILDSGYCGPIGILDHRSELDAEKSLRQNLEGLQQVIQASMAASAP